MTLPCNDQDGPFMRFTPSSTSRPVNTATKRKKQPPPHPVSELQPNESNANEFSWPILLAIIPTLGTFLTGSSEIWSDFIMILLILYYVYKWMTVPWSYYEGARSRRIIHFNATLYNSASSPSSSTTPGDKQQGQSTQSRQERMANELRRHELIGLISVLASPIVAGYTLQYSRYFLSDYERYMSSFNVGVFVLAASLKPLSHVMLLLRERTVYLQSEIQVNETHVQRLQKKLDVMEAELDVLREAFATKGELDQATGEFNPTLQQLTIAIRHSEKQERLLRSWSEDKFALIDNKVREFDKFISYKIDQEQQRMAKHSTITTLVLLPLVWIIKLVTSLLPLPHALLGAAPSTATSSSTASFDLPSIPLRSSSSNLRHSHKPLIHKSSAMARSGKHLTHPDLLSCPTTPDPTTNTVY